MEQNRRKTEAEEEVKVLEIHTTKNLELLGDERSHRHTTELCPHPFFYICFTTMPGKERTRTWSCKHYFSYPYEFCNYPKTIKKEKE